jgi:large subunit ribosomal protein L30
MPETRKRAPARTARPRRTAGEARKKASGKRAAAKAVAGQRATAKGEAARRPAGKAAAAGTLTVVQVRSAIACPQRQRRILRSLGLRGPNDRRQLPDHPSVRGMVAALPHLVRIEPGGAEQRSRT